MVLEDDIATLSELVQRMVDESGTPVGFDALSWLDQWLLELAPAFGRRRPLDVLSEPGGLDLVRSHLLRAQSVVLFPQGFLRIGNDRARRCGRASFWLHLGLFFIPGLARLQAALIEIAPPDHDLVGIADVIERRDLTTGKLLAILMSQHLQLELRTVRAALGAQTVDAVQAVVAHPRANLLLGNRPPPSQELRAAFASQEALDHFQLELRFVLLHVTP